jgi:hypothetical protein
MPKARFEFCDACVNSEIPYECVTCKDGSKFEAADAVEELTVHELRMMTIPTEDDE